MCVWLIGILACSDCLIAPSKKYPREPRLAGVVKLIDLRIDLTVDLLFEELDEFVFGHAALLAGVAVA